MRTSLYQWIKTNAVMLVNAMSLIGTTVVTSGLGFVFWWLAARRFPVESVGIASASISAMMLLGSLCMLGMGTLLITELPRQPSREGSLISTALLVVGGTGGSVGVLFALLAPFASADFLPLRASISTILMFALGVSLTAITLVLDQALVGLLSGELQLWRNTLFSIAKLAVLLLVSFWLSYTAGIAIYATWAIGSVFSLISLAGVALWKGKWSGRIYLPQWGLMRKMGRAALQHHLLNLALQAPGLLIPLLVTVLLSAKMNAWFYVAEMLASFVYMIPYALTMVLHAMNSAQPSSLGHKARVTIGLAFVTCLLANFLLQFDTKQVLGIFGSSYAEQATWSLRILALQAFPLIIQTHYLAICRIRDQIAQAMLGMVAGGLLELVLAAMGAHFGGLSGLCLGQTGAIYIEALFMLRTVYKTVRFANPVPQTSIGQEDRELSPIWLMDTAILMAIEPRYQTNTLQAININAFLRTPTKANLSNTADDEGKNDIRRHKLSQQNTIDRLRHRRIRLERDTANHPGEPLITIDSSS